MKKQTKNDTSEKDNRYLLDEKGLHALAHCKRIQKFEWFSYGMLAVLITLLVVIYIMGDMGFYVIRVTRTG